MSLGSLCVMTNDSMPIKTVTLQYLSGPETQADGDIFARLDVDEVKKLMTDMAAEGYRMMRAPDTYLDGAVFSFQHVSARN